MSQTKLFLNNRCKKTRKPSSEKVIQDTEIRALDSLRRQLWPSSTASSKKEPARALETQFQAIAVLTEEFKLTTALE